MYKDYIHNYSDTDSPYEFIERDIDLYGENYLYSLDDIEFLLNYGITKDEFFHEYSVNYNCYKQEKLLNENTNHSFNEEGLDNLVEEFKNESVNLLATPKVTNGGSSLINKPTPIDNRTSVKPSELRSKPNNNADSARENNQPNSESGFKPVAPKKNNKPRPAPYPAPQSRGSDSTELSNIKKEYKRFIRYLVQSARSPLARRRVNLHDKAFRAAILEEGVMWGSAPWGDLLVKFFPGVDIGSFGLITGGESGEITNNGGNQENNTGESGESTVEDSGDSVNSGGESRGGANGESGSTGRGSSANNAEEGGGESISSQGGSTENIQAGGSGESPNSGGGANNNGGGGEQASNNAETGTEEGGSANAEQEENGNSEAGGENSGGESSAATSGGGGANIKISKPESTEAKIETTNANTDGLEKVGDVMARESETAVNKGKEKIGKVANEQRTTRSADQKLNETEKAVEPPASESVSEVNSQAVDNVAAIPEPEVDPNTAKQSVARAMAEKLPKTADDVKDLVENNPAAEASVEMNQLIKSQTANVQGTYNEIEQTATPETKSAEAPLPEIEQAPSIPNLNLSEGVIVPPAGEQSDFQEHVQATDDLVKNELQHPSMLQEFETSDAAPMVEARNARDGIKEDAEKAPEEAKNIEQQEQNKLNNELSKEEKATTDQISQERQKGLTEAQSDQKSGKSKFELEREKVSQDINKIYERANSQIKDKLELLELKSMKSFEEGQQKALATFEKNVDKELEEFFEERHSGFAGFFRAIGDWFSGTDDLPEVQEIFNRNRTIYVSTINRLIDEISENSKKVINDCKQILADARTEIDDYVSNLSGKLKEYGQNCQKDISAKLDKLSENIKKKEEELKNKLEELRKSAIEAIDKRIEERKESMKGALSKFGDMVLDLAMKFFMFTLTSMGMSPDEVMNIINKGVAVITAIVTDPMGFFSNLGSAVGQGLGQFRDNFKKHMIGGMLEWLTGAMGGTIEIPTEFSLKGILKMGLSALGLTWLNIRTKLVKHVGEKPIAAAEKGLEVVTKVVTEGPIGLWEWLKAEAESIKNQVIDGIKEWALMAIVKSAITQLALMLNPAGAIVRAIIAIYDLIVWLKDNIQRIISFVNSVFSSIANIAAGNIGGAANFIEAAIAKTIPMILSGLAQFLKLGGIAKKVRQVIKKVRKPIDKAINKGIKFITKKVKKWFGKSKGKKPKKGEAKDIKNENKKGKADKLNAKDNKKHKQIANKIESKLKQNKIKEKESFEEFHARKKKEGEALEDKYQPQLKKGINLDVKFKSVGEDKKDGDMDIKVSIKPNNLDDSFVLDADTGDVKDIPVGKGDLIKAKYTKGKFLADVTKVDKKEKEEGHKYRYKKLTKRDEKNTFSDFKKKWDKGDIEKVNEERKHLIENRPSYKAGLVEKVWKNAQNSKGRVFCPNSEEELFWVESKSRFDQWHMGHRKKHKYSHLVDRYISGEISYDEFLEEYNDPNAYYPEHPKANMSHKFE